jgi:hypothetical protein
MMIIPFIITANRFNAVPLLISPGAVNLLYPFL